VPERTTVGATVGERTRTVHWVLPHVGVGIPKDVSDPDLDDRRATP
jgi:hypothetical protein